MPDAMRNLHVPLPVGLYDRLRMAAEREGRPGTVLVREAVENWLYQRERQLLHDKIAEYAREVAGATDDLDPELLQASEERLAGDANQAPAR